MLKNPIGRLLAILDNTRRGSSNHCVCVCVSVC